MRPTNLLPQGTDLCRRSQVRFRSKWRMLFCCLFVSLFFSTPSWAGRCVGIAIAKSSDHVYAWFDDGMVTSGTIEDFEYHRHAVAYTLPGKRTPADIVAVSIARNDHVYAWYRDGMVSSGTSSVLDAYTPAETFVQPMDKQIAGIGISGTTDHVYTWYRDGSLSEGTSRSLTEYHTPHPYTLPSGLGFDSIVEVDIASGDHVYAWYRDGTVSEGTSVNLDQYDKRRGYIDRHVLHQVWLPGPRPTPSSPPLAATLSHGEGDIHEQSSSIKFTGTVAGLIEAVEASGGESPVFSERFVSPLGAKDLMVAVGHEYLIASDDHNLAFINKKTHATILKLPARGFFSAFLSPVLPGGAFNWDNVNQHLGFSAPCNSTYYPATTGNKFCIDEFYDVRVIFDPQSRRFFVISNSRNALWGTSPPNCKYCPAGGNPFNCSDSLIMAPQYCALTRRSVAFAVSRTENPMQGFDQYMITENLERDWPWIAVNDTRVIIGSDGDDPNSTMATVFQREALLSGAEHPPYFRIPNGFGVQAALPVTHHGNTQNLTFLRGVTHSDEVKIIAIPQSDDPWTAPPLLSTSVDINSSPNPTAATTYRNGMLYLIGTTAVESTRRSVHVVRIPVQRDSGGLSTSKDAAKGFVNYLFGRNAPEDAPGDRVSYKNSSIAVNKDGDMLIGYSRLPFATAQPLFPEARYTFWKGLEASPRTSRLLTPRRCSFAR